MSVQNLRISDSLHDAVKTCDLTQIKLLLATGTQIDSLDDKGFTPVHHACLMGKITLLEILVRNGANPEAAVRDKGQTALHVAAFRGHYGIVKFLVDNGAVMDAVDISGNTPLMLASKRAHHEVVLFLLKNSDCLVNQRNLQQQTALSFAILSKSKRERITKCVHTLVCYGADVHTVDINGWTPLLHAIFHNRTEIIKFLIKWNVDFIPCSEYKTIISPWVAALSFARLEICQIMYEGKYHMEDFRRVVFDPNLLSRYPQLGLFPLVQRWINEVKSHKESVQRLQTRCKDVIRSAMGLGVPIKVRTTGLPKALQDYIVN